jgi:F0F1-type ATP synthase membrane subunit b/b'
MKLHFLSTLLRSALSLGLVVFASLPAWASSGGHHEPSIADLGVFWVNFIIYSALLFVLVRKPIGSAWAARRASIMTAVTSATDEVGSAERELNATEALLKNLSAEQDRARAEIVRQGKVEAEAIAEAAHEKAERIKAQAKELLKGEGRSAEAAFRATLVAKALEMSREKFARGEYSAKQSQYVDAALSRAKRLV